MEKTSIPSSKNYTKAVERMLSTELDTHLDNEKYEKSKERNYHNRTTSKTIKTTFGKDQIQILRDRKDSFEPALVPKRYNIIEGLEKIIIFFYTKGMSVSDIEE